MNTPIHPTGDSHTPLPNSGGSSTQANPEFKPTSLVCAIRSEDLLQGQPSIAIAHHGAIYRLQTTRQGKLILTK